MPNLRFINLYLPNITVGGVWFFKFFFNILCTEARTDSTTNELKKKNCV